MYTNPHINIESCRFTYTPIHEKKKSKRKKLKQMILYRYHYKIWFKWISNFNIIRRIQEHIYIEVHFLFWCDIKFSFDSKILTISFLVYFSLQKIWKYGQWMNLRQDKTKINTPFKVTFQCYVFVYGSHVLNNYITKF